jgi:hypothetical protein
MRAHRLLFLAAVLFGIILNTVITPAFADEPQAQESLQVKGVKLKPYGTHLGAYVNGYNVGTGHFRVEKGKKKTWLVSFTLDLNIGNKAMHLVETVSLDKNLAMTQFTHLEQETEPIDIMGTFQEDGTLSWRRLDSGGERTETYQDMTGGFNPIAIQAILMALDGEPGAQYPFEVIDPKWVSKKSGSAEFLGVTEIEHRGEKLTARQVKIDPGSRDAITLSYVDKELMQMTFDGTPLSMVAGTEEEVHQDLGSDNTAVRDAVGAFVLAYELKDYDGLIAVVNLVDVRNRLLVEDPELAGESQAAFEAGIIAEFDARTPVEREKAETRSSMERVGCEVEITLGKATVRMLDRQTTMELENTGGMWSITWFSGFLGPVGYMP